MSPEDQYDSLLHWYHTFWGILTGVCKNFQFYYVASKKQDKICINFAPLSERIWIDEYWRWYVWKSPSFFSHNFFLNTAKIFCIVQVSINQSFILQISRLVDPLGETFDLFSPLGLDIQRYYDLKVVRNNKF